MKRIIVALGLVVALVGVPAMAMAGGIGDERPEIGEPVGTTEPVDGDGPTASKYHIPPEETDINGNTDDPDAVELTADHHVVLDLEVTEGDLSDEGAVGVCVVGANSPCNGDDPSR